MWTSRNFWPKLEKGYVLLIYFEQIVSFCAIFYSNTNSLQLFCENSNLNSANFTERVFFCVNSWKYFSQLSLVTFVTNSTSGWNPCAFIVTLTSVLIWLCWCQLLSAMSSPCTPVWDKLWGMLKHSNIVEYALRTRTSKPQCWNQLDSHSNYLLTTTIIEEKKAKTPKWRQQFILSTG